MTPLRPAGAWFVLWAKDEEFACSVLEQRFYVEDLDALRAVLRDEDDDESFDPTMFGWELEPDGLRAVVEAFGVGEAFIDLPSVHIDGWHSIRDIPYLSHTNFELFLMLEGRKPFAQFQDVYPGDWLDVWLKPFEPHVAAGRLVQRVIDEPFEKPIRLPNGGTALGSRRVCFTLPGQEWRIDAYLLLWKIAAKTRWNDTLETLEGCLYGYEDWQIDWWLTERRRERAEAQKQD